MLDVWVLGQSDLRSLGDHCAGFLGVWFWELRVEFEFCGCDCCSRLSGLLVMREWICYCE
jgi:hypothetical protein